MSKWLKQFLFGIWGLLLIPLIMPILDKWLEENIFDSTSTNCRMRHSFVNTSNVSASF